jgi:hypothetical protein
VLRYGGNKINKKNSENIYELINKRYTIVPKKICEMKIFTNIEARTADITKQLKHDSAADMQNKEKSKSNLTMDSKLSNQNNLNSNKTQTQTNVSYCEVYHKVLLALYKNELKELKSRNKCWNNPNEKIFSSMAEFLLEILSLIFLIDNFSKDIL